MKGKTMDFGQVDGSELSVTTDGGLTFSIGKPRLFRCPNGHEFEQSEPWHAYVAEEPGHTSGPVCQYCYVDWMKKQFPVSEVEAQG